jgi:hypothetical protein
MMESLDADVADAESARETRDEVVARVRQHAGQMARELARIEGGDYGRKTFRVDGGEWTVKYEAGDLEFLRFEGRAGLDVYAVSTKQAPDLEPLSRALEHYEALAAAFNDYVAGLEGILDETPGSFPAVASAGDVVAERDRIVDAFEGAADQMAAQLHRFESGDYGAWAVTIRGTRWELKREVDTASYVRVGGEDGVYLVSQYGAPSARDVREHAGAFQDFVRAFNEDVAELHDELDAVTL